MGTGARSSSFRLASALLLALTGALVWVGLQSHRGPVLLALSRSHGVDLADGALLPPLLWGTALLAGTFHPRVVRPSRAVAATLVACFAVVTGLLGGLDLSRANRRLGSEFDTLAPAAFLVLAILSVVTTTAGAYPWPRSTRRRFGTAVLAVSVGLVVDVAVLPSGTVFGPAALAGCLAARGPGRARVALLVLIAASVVISAASLADLGGLDVLLARSGGGGARGLAFGAVALVGSLDARSRRAGSNIPASNRTARWAATGR